MKQDFGGIPSPSTRRILLIDDAGTDYPIIRSHLGDIEGGMYQLDWIDADTEPNAEAISGYDAYILNYPDTRWLPIALQLPSKSPVIVLTETAEIGLAALQTGVADYWAKDCLSPLMLERSLRLTLARTADEQTIAENERAFQLGDERLHSVLSSIEDAVWSFDPRIDKLLYLNSAVESMYDRSLSDFLADLTLWRSCIHPDDRATVDRADAALIQTRSFNLEYRIVRPDGSVRWLREQTHLIFDTT
ncbi:MAG: PAS domain-containing protein, partial [Geitlerinemataceae cyanobacterium]